MLCFAGQREDLAHTRERFNEVLKRYAELEKKKRAKKKQKETPETIVVGQLIYISTLYNDLQHHTFPTFMVVFSFKLENLRKNLNLEKDNEEDETILQNTYVPEQGSPRYTKNKRREKETSEKINISSTRNQDELPASKGKKKSRRELPPLTAADGTLYCIKQGVQDDSAEHHDEGRVKEVKAKNKRAKSKGDLESKVESLVEDVEDKLLLEYQQRITQDEDETSKPRAKTEEESFVSQKSTLNNDMGRKKKKKLKSVVAQLEDRFERFSLFEKNPFCHRLFL